MAMTRTRIPVAEMASLIESGEAIPLFPEYDVGPTWLERTWWHVPQQGDHENYEPASPELGQEFGDMYTRHLVLYERLEAHLRRDGIELPTGIDLDLEILPGGSDPSGRS